MRNTLLKVQLNCTDVRHCTTKKIGHVSIICKESEKTDVLHRFFDCYNQNPDDVYWGNWFNVTTEELPIWEFTDDSRFVEELDEDNPFELDSYENAWVWRNLNEHLYHRKNVAPVNMFAWV